METPTDSLEFHAQRVSAAGDDLSRLIALVALRQLVDERIERAETDALRAGVSIGAVARARKVSRQYMSRRARTLATTPERMPL
jgi:hypothetical protein